MNLAGIDWSWYSANYGEIRGYFDQHVYLSLVPVAIGLAVSVPLGLVCARFRVVRPVVLGLTTVVYAIPSLALFVILINFTPNSLDETVMIPLTLYSLCILVRGVVDGLSNVPDVTRQSATAMGYGRFRRLVAVELPVAVPVIVAALRVATVSSISLLSVASLIGGGALGQLFVEGEQSDFPTEIWAGIALTVLLAFVADAVITLAGRLLTPWAVAARAQR